MANKKISDLPAASAANLTDILEKTNDPSGTPASQKLTVQQLINLVIIQANPPVVYTVNPNTESLVPINQTKPCVAYSANGSGAFFGWNTSSLVWQVLMLVCLLAGLTKGRAASPSFQQVTNIIISNILVPRKLGFVTKNSWRLPENANGGNFTYGSRAGYIAAVNITNVAAAYPNFYGPAEAAMSAAAGISSAVEYPVGVVQRLQFNGIPRGVIPAGQYAISDLTTLSNVIPMGAKFWVRTYYTNSSGIVYFNNLANPGFDYTDQYGAAMSDQTTNTGAIGSPDSALYTPMAIIGNNLGVSVLTLGDSRDAGYLGENSTPFQPLFGIDLVVGKYYPQQDFSVGGEGFFNSISNRLCFIKYASHVVSSMGYNGFVDVTEVSNLTVFASQFAPLPFYAETIFPSTISSDNWTTLAGQVAQFGYTNFNTQLRGGLVPGVAGVIDVAAVNESSLNSGRWAVTGKANGVTADGVHGPYYTRLATAIPDFLRASVPKTPTTAGDFNGVAAGTFYLVTNAFCPVPDAAGGWYWNSNSVLYWVTSTRTNLLNDGR